MLRDTAVFNNNGAVSGASRREAVLHSTLKQEMLEFCPRKNVLPEVEMIRMDRINQAYVRLEQPDFATAP